MPDEAAPDEAALRRVERAEARLERVRRRLRAAQAAAHLGAGAPGERDAAVLAHRVAQAEAAACAAVDRRSGGAPGPGVPPTWPPVEPSPRLRFARWLVEAGRLSDWIDPE
jgi:hypothetical protein